jgi:Peptidase M50B-like
MDESGLTRFSGGWYCAIVPAGYIGSSLAGCILLFAGFGKKSSRYLAIAINIILVLTLFWAGSLATIIISVVLVAAMTFSVWYQEGVYTQYLIIFMGTIASIVSVLNILSSTVFHTIDGSDAVAFAKHCSFLVPSFVYGLLWAFSSLTLIAASVGAALIFFK